MTVAAGDDLPEDFLEACGYAKLGGRAIRIDVLDRVAIDLQRQSRAGKMDIGAAQLNLLGLSMDDARPVFEALGYVAEKAPKAEKTPEAAEAKGSEAKESKESTESTESTESAESGQSGQSGETGEELVWKWVGRRRPGPERPKRPRQGKKGKPGDRDKPGDKGNKGKSKRSENAPRKPAPIDENSPFAKLKDFKFS